ncbi:MAG: 30S ribosomal protein S7 [Candidatus Micrarchaeota archaeon]|nr:30S ribosomal protein S7 [Candidatus Micrarchaeota archaeon]MDE1834073.1 30S ribosomal protein S7 [Candidatus Micrarchaeota archaeon]MDE1859673.1 30S ribosomal protein S7 [Candidatus Micrarchaeota archaeon]
MPQPEDGADRPRKAPRKAPGKDAPALLEEQLLFEKYDIKGVSVTDQSLVSYVKTRKTAYPNMFGRRKYQAYYNSHVDIVERLINKLMRGGTGRKISGKVIRRKGGLQGKKLKIVHVLEDAFELIHKNTGKNPVQMLIDAVQNAAPIEDTTRVRYGGISYNVAVGISSQRRLDVALRNLAVAGLISSFKNKRTLAEALANEITLAASNSSESYAVKKRVEVERIAKRAR